MILQEINILLKYKIKLLLRFDYASKFLFKYYLIFFPMYAYILYALNFYQNLFFTICIYSIVILGIDYHSLVNKSNINTLYLFVMFNDKKKSILLSLTIDFLFKLFLFIPILFFANSGILSLLYCILFILFSFLFKELIIRNFFPKVTYSFLFFIFIFISNIFGNFFLDELKKNQIERIKWVKTNFDIIFIVLIFSVFLIIVIQFIIFNKHFDKVKS